jgi:hypothetical protein
MSDRMRALEILRRARDLLADRMSERILESEEGLLDDARGDSYLGDIDSIFDLFGTKLTHLNQMINNLPLETEPAAAPASDSAHHAAGDYASAAEAILPEETLTMHPMAITGPLLIAPPGLPAPRTEEAPQRLAPNFYIFAAQMRSDQLHDAARTLASLLDISEARGMQCVRIFHRRWRDEEEFIFKATQLHDEVMASSYNNALMLLAECFGLVGIEAIGVLQTLRERFIQSP